MLRVFLLFFLGLLFQGNPVSAQKARTLDKIIAVVDEYPILQSDIEIQLLQMQEKITDTAEMSCKILRQMIINKMFTAQAKTDSLVVRDEEVEQELERRMRYFISVFGSKEKLEKHYDKTTLELKNEFREDVQEQLMAERMKQKITAGLSPTPSEVKAFYKDIPQDSLPYFNSEIQIAQVAIIPKAGKLQRMVAKEKIYEIKRDIENNGADFTTQAVLYSDDPGSSALGGNLGLISRGELVPEFEASAFKLEIGKLSEPVETKYGFHLIQTLEKKGEKIKARHILVVPKVTSEDIEKAAVKADSIYAKLKSGRLSFEKAVSEYSDDDATKNSGGLLQNPSNGSTYFEMTEVDGGLSFALDKLSPGDFSEVMPYATQDGKKGYRILKLISQTEPHQASLEKDYTKLKNATMQNKQQKVIDRWVVNSKENMYIRIDKAYNKCAL
ncbi:MAG: peptidylprolyl isomerase [Chitinophagales bacterium]|nr:peptidylprolyl isomerase [Chitinophagales bacterium]